MKFDVVVIGSGFGGAIVAARLGQAGRRVCILERGRYIQPRPAWKRKEKGKEGSSGELPLPRFTREDKDHIGETAIWNPETGKYGYIDFGSFRGVDVLRGAAVGGGSLIYYGVSERAPGDVFQDPWPGEITRDLLDRYYDRVEKMLALQRISQRLDKYDLPERTRKFQEMAKACGIDAELLDLAISFSHSRGMQKPCDFRGQCLVGCNQNAKNSLDFNYLKLARHSGCIIQPGSEVRLIKPSGSGYVVAAQRLGQDTVDHYRAEKVVLAAGSLGSTELLLRSVADPGGIKIDSPALGKRFSTNGDYIYSGIQYRGRSTFPEVGPHSTVGLRYPRKKGGTFFIHDLGIPDALSPLLEATARLTPGADTIGLSSFRKFLSGINKKWPDLPGDPSEWLMPLIVMGQEDYPGSISLRNGKLEVHWPYLQNRKYYEEVRDAMKDLAHRSGGQFRDNVWAGAVVPPSTLTAHPVGGCPMGENDGEGVVDHEGRVFGHRNLYIADGSIFPTAISANPSLTIAAMAERIAFRMINRRELGSG